MKQTVRWTCFAFVAIGMSGCGGSSDLPDTVAAGGVVTYNGDPLPAAKIVFRTAGGRPATAISGPDGRFILSTFGEHDGAVPGDHVVTVIKTLKAGAGDGGSTDPSHADTMEAAAEASERQAQAGAGDSSESIIPSRYSNPETSQLKFTIGDSGDDENISIQLTD